MKMNASSTAKDSLSVSHPAFTGQGEPLQKIFSHAHPHSHPHAQTPCKNASQRQQDVSNDIDAKNVLEQAEQGDSNAQLQAGMLFCSGHHVTQNMIEAHKWFNIAFAQGNKKALGERQFITSMLSKEELRQALKLARIWQDKYKTRTSHSNIQLH